MHTYQAYPSYRMMQDLLPCCLGEVYDLYRHLMQLIISYISQAV